MIMNESDNVIKLVYEKLKILERKLELSYSNAKNDNTKLIQLGDDLMSVRGALTRLKDKTLSWKELEKFGITKNLTYKEFDNDNNSPQEFNDFGLLASIPQLKISDAPDDEFINHVYSIIDYLNHNYQTIFTQKILLTSSKSNTIREKFYLQYQEIMRLFKNYHQLTSYNQSGRSNEQLIYKEYKVLITKIITLLQLMQKYFMMIQDDPTFSKEDFLHLVISLDPNSTIHNLTLQTAFEECKHYIEEALKYIYLNESDIVKNLE